MNSQLRYGPVQIIGGKYKDLIGYYDDDDGDKAIVYFNDIFSPEDSFELIPHRFLINSDVVLANLERFKRKEFV